jgi:CRISPR/Cas system-associated protein Cas10 (large subunit of type III CRISPR-Cas system)
MAVEWNDYLVSFDTDRIKDYLFATNRLKEIRGASALLASLDRRRRKSLIKEFGDQAVVYSAGGGASVLLADPNEAEMLIYQIEKAFHEETKTGSITGVAIEPEKANSTTSESGEKRKFGERMKKAAAELSLQKSQKAELAFMPVEPHFRLCDSCGQHPASGRARDGLGDLLCTSCLTKRDWGYEQRRGLYYRFRADVKKKGGKQLWQKDFLPEDLDAIGAISRPPGYIGFLALDGNKMGEILEKLPHKENYRKYSEGLVRLMEEITFEALRKFAQPRLQTAPFEIVLIGGDDLMLFTTADIAIPVAQFILTEFEKHSPQLKVKAGLSSEPLTMAAGVVLAHSNYPIPAMHGMAEALLKSAKRYCSENNYQSSAIDFEVISGSGATFETAREGIPHRRPYSRDEIDKLLHHIGELKKVNFPTSQLHAMYQTLFADSWIPGVMATLRVLGRAREEFRKPLRDFFRDFIPSSDKPMMLPWSELNLKKEKPEWRSPLIDLVDLYPFIKNEGNTNVAHTP